MSDLKPSTQNQGESADRAPTVTPKSPQRETHCDQERIKSSCETPPQCRYEITPPVKRVWGLTKFERIVAILTASAVVIAFFTGLFILNQSGVMRKDQRPWIKITYETPSPSQDTLGTLEFINLGKTPAKDITGEAVAEAVRLGEQPTFDYPHPHMYIEAGTLFPGDSPPNKLLLYRVRFGSDGSVEKYPFSASEVDDIQQGRMFVIAYGTVRYRDFFGIDHWTKFCQYAAISGVPHETFGGGSSEEPLKSCIEYSDIDQN